MIDQFGYPLELETPMAEDTAALVASVSKCVQGLHDWLVPPFEPFQAKRFVEQLAGEANAEAACVLLVSSEDRNRLDPVAHTGYFADFADLHYFVGDESLTSRVFRNQTGVAGSAEYLMRSQKASGRCRRYLQSNEWRNTIAIPIRFGSVPLGILKVENKRSLPFDSTDIARAQILAQSLGILYQQTVYNQLWNEVLTAQQQTRSLRNYLDSVVNILAERIGAESAAIYLKDAKGVSLECVAGFGLTSEFRATRHDLGGQSFVAEIANASFSVCLTASEIADRKLPLLPEDPLISGNAVRNVLALAIAGREGRLGVLELFNKSPNNAAAFDPNDLAVCRALVRQQILPAVLRLSARVMRDEDTSGQALLIARFAEDRAFAKKGINEKIVAVNEFRVQNSALVSADDCTQFLSVSRAQFYKVVSAARKDRA